MELTNEQLASVTGGFGIAAAWDHVRCASYRADAFEQRGGVAKDLTKLTSQQYLDAQAAIEKPEPAYCASSPVSTNKPSSVLP